MKNCILLIVSALCVLVISCAGSDDPGSGASGTFSLVNSPTGSSSVLDIVYGDDISGDITYIVSDTDLNLSTVSGFDASEETKTTVTVTTDGLLYDDYIPISSLSSNTEYHVYVNHNGRVEALTQTTCPDSTAGKAAITGTITGSEGTYDYTITFPADYSTTGAKWPFLVAMKVYGLTDPDFPCVVFTINVYSGATTDNTEINTIKTTIKDFIEDSSNNIDLDRIYLFGYSAGANAAILIANDDQSDKYDIRAVLIEGARYWTANYCSNLGNTDIWLFYGETDGEYNTDIITALDGLTGTGEHLQTVMPDTGHTYVPVRESPVAMSWLLNK
ncbi:MAG TPA: hypothetical protein PK926_14525 [Spirochaetota bacterium]|nr:hypothetical protein [Spirochaetota bacterium]HPI90987.1 hypothetical protein [Spirochaetota bacterium]HPR49449.1 hypothetical protein [Spirochaetota bacterium]